MRPDILVVTDLPLAYLLGKRRPQWYGGRPEWKQEAVHGAQRQNWVFGYTTDLRYNEKLKEKEAQHEQLADALTSQGWAVHRHTILLGMGGAM